MAANTSLSVLPQHLHRGFFPSELSRRSELRGYNFFVHGYIHGIRFYVTTPGKEVSVKGFCYRSMRKHANPHRLHINADIPERCFSLCHCSCTAGQSGKCSHLVALVYTLINYQLQGLKEVPAELSVTSLPQQWHKPRGAKIRPEHIKSMVFAKPKPKEKRKRAPVVPAYHSQRIPALSELDVSKLQEKSGMALNYLLSPNREMQEIAIGKVQRGSMLIYQLKDHEVFKPRNDQVAPCGSLKFPLDTPWDLREDSQVCNQVCPVSPAEAHSLEEATCQQSDCPLWHTARKGRLTASTFHRVTNRVKAVDEKFLESLFNPKGVETAAMNHGKQSEGKAKSQYMKDFPDRHLHDCGLVVNPKFSFLGASPDAKVCQHGTTGLLEIKCPYHLGGEKFMDVALKSKTFFLEVSEEKLRLKRSHPYFTQVQGQLLVTGAPFCDFYVYSGYDKHCERILPNPEKCKEMLEKLSLFYKIHAMPYLDKNLH